MKTEACGIRKQHDGATGTGNKIETFGMFRFDKRQMALRAVMCYE